MPYRIGSGAGFSGDRTDAPIAVVNDIARHGNGGAIIFETIGERTLALGQLARQRDPEQGYEPLLDELIRPILRPCIENNLVIVGNFGCANTRAAARRLAVLAGEEGLKDVRIAVVEGDDIRDRFHPDREEVWEGDRALPPLAGEIISANAYVGARAIADAIAQGAQVVVTGRVADPALALGPLVAHFGWRWDDADLLAAGTLVGHLLECGSQVTGGFFADPGWKDVPSPENIGFPIAEVDGDGSFAITKPRGTGGLVDLRTVKEQILYEIHDPSRYLTPDVTLDITQVRLRQVAPDRVHVSGARGHAAPAKLKATVGYHGDWLGEAEISYAGPNAEARARLAAQTLRRRLALRGLDRSYRIDLIGLTSAFDNDAGELWSSMSDTGVEDVRVRLAARAADRRTVEQCMREMTALYCCGPAGGGGVRTHIVPRVETRSFMVERSAAPTSFQFIDARE